MSPGDRVQCRPGALPTSYGQPLAEVVRVGRKTALVRLLSDRSERRIPHDLLKPAPRR